jgi:RNA polymerase sigma factor (sigma-70 family)
LADTRDNRDRTRAEERSAIDQAAGRVLSERQQHVIRRSLEGWSVAEIAEELQAPAARISDEKYKAIQRLRAELAQSA